MANQSIGTPRFYIDYTQLAKVKGFFYDPSMTVTESGQDNNAYGLNDDYAAKNMNVWNFDYANPTTYYTTDDIDNPRSVFQFRLNFWDCSNHNTEANWEWAKLMSTCNWGGVFNHNLGSAFPTSNVFNKNLQMTFWDGGYNMENDPTGGAWGGGFQDDGNSTNLDFDKDGYTFLRGSGSDNTALLFPGGMASNGIDADAAKFGGIVAQIVLDDTYTHSDGLEFKIGSICFGKYIDMPNSPDLSLTKSVIYDGIKTQRSLGGADYINVDHLGSPDWLTGEPWVLSNQTEVQRRGRIGKNGRRSWKMQFSYITNDDLFYDQSSENIAGETQYDGETGNAYAFYPTSEIQQIWDFTLGGALPFIFTPDKDAENPEFCVAKFKENSLHAEQVAHQTWNVKMTDDEVW